MREGGLSSGGRGRTRGPLWRWRRNPLRRHTDVLEAWFLLAVWALVVVGGTLVGLVTARAAGQSFDRQRTERTQVRAVLLTDAPRTAVAGTGGDLTSARVRWTAPDGTRHSDSTLVPGGLRAGSTAEIWLDAWGRPSSAPLTSGEASAESALLGVSAALALTGAAFGVRCAGRWWLDRRRIEEWDREWALLGPRWGHKTG
ncbi:Rv1733c family protein [Streptomyces sp. NPDC001675]